MIKQSVFLENQVSGVSRFYEAPVKKIVANKPEEVCSAIIEIERALSEGLHVAGYAAYEMGYIFEPCLLELYSKPRLGPLINFGVFNSASFNLKIPSLKNGLSLSKMKPVWSEETYSKVFNKVMNYIHSGDVYQVNLTFPMVGKFNNDPFELYKSLREFQPVKYGGLVCLGDPTIMSLSPELFFSTSGKEVSMRPMKGTCRRGKNLKEDQKLVNMMRADKKSQAENLMIVDLLRNDLAKISEIGSVKVTDLYNIETYSTLHQMTSSIESTLKENLSLYELFKALFPCGSVTGAPKIRAMEIIHELENGPRGAYCGAIGYMDPSGESCFNVAIRSMSLFNNGMSIYNTGSAIVADSSAKDEYQECLLKAKVISMNSGEK